MSTNQAKPTELLPEPKAFFDILYGRKGFNWWWDGIDEEIQTEIIEELNRTHSPAQAEWQPIESAPKDGEDVLLWIPSEGVVDIAYWREDAKAWDTNIGWLQSTPSHWMRPQPPKDDKQ